MKKLKMILVSILFFMMNVNTSFAGRALESKFIPSVFVLWMIRFIILLILLVLIFIIVRIKLKRKRVKLLINVVLIFGILSCIWGTVFMGIQNVIRGGPRFVYEGNVSGSYYNMSLIQRIFDFSEKIDWRQITNLEYKNKDIKRDMPKLYEGELNEIIGKDEWYINKKTSKISEEDFKYLEWEIGYRNENEENIILKIRNDKDFWQQIYEHIYYLFETEGRSILGTFNNDLEYNLKLLPNSGPTTENRKINILGISDFSVILDQISVEDVANINLKKFNFITALKKNGINFIVTSKVDDVEQIVNEVLDKLKKCSGGELKVKISLSSREVSFFPSYDEITIIILPTLEQNRYESQRWGYQPVY